MVVWWLTCTVRLLRRKRMAWRVRTHFFKKGISGSVVVQREVPWLPGGTQNMAAQSAGLSATLLTPNGTDDDAPELVPSSDAIAIVSMPWLPPAALPVVPLAVPLAAVVRLAAVDVVRLAAGVRPAVLPAVLPVDAVRAVAALAVRAAVVPVVRPADVLPSNFNS
jgi:hypothetical protein